MHLNQMDFTNVSGFYLLLCCCSNIFLLKVTQQQNDQFSDCYNQQVANTTYTSNIGNFYKYD